MSDLEYEADPVLDRARRYELQASRDFSRTLVDLRRAAALAEPEVEPEHAVAPEPCGTATAEPSEPAAGDARPTGDGEADPDNCEGVAAGLGSFGGVPVVAPVAPGGPIPPYHDAEPAPFYPPIRS